MKKIWNWLIYSSKNAEKYSLTIKGLANFIPSFVILMGLFNVKVEPQSAQAVIDSLATVVMAFYALIAAVYTLVGFVRKLYSTAVGNNDVILSGKC